MIRRSCFTATRRLVRSHSRVLVKPPLVLQHERRLLYIGALIYGVAPLASEAPTREGVIGWMP